VRNFRHEIDWPTSRSTSLRFDKPLAFPIGIERYHRMIELGLFDATDKVELLDGYLVSKMPQGDNHHFTVEILSRLLMQRFDASIGVTVQLPIRLEDSEPEPDLALVTPARQRNRKKPTADQVYLVIEVAESSLIADRDWKLRTYAKAGIAEYWIVNLVDKQIEVCTEPDGELYRSTKIYRPGDAVPLTVAGQTVAPIPVDEVLP
jgi:Uma2 family endonuclease